MTLGAFREATDSVLHRLRTTQTSVWLNIEELLKNITWTQGCKKQTSKKNSIIKPLY